MQLGDAMARRSWHVENMAEVIGAEPEEVRSWLRGEETPRPYFIARMLNLLFAPGSLAWSAFTTAHLKAQRD
jgi:hypothetical protein